MCVGMHFFLLCAYAVRCICTCRMMHMCMQVMHMYMQDDACVHAVQQFTCTVLTHALQYTCTVLHMHYNTHAQYYNYYT